MGNKSYHKIWNFTKHSDYVIFFIAYTDVSNDICLLTQQTKHFCHFSIIKYPRLIYQKQKEKHIKEHLSMLIARLVQTTLHYI